MEGKIPYLDYDDSVVWLTPEEYESVVRAKRERIERFMKPFTEPEGKIHGRIEILSSPVENGDVDYKNLWLNSKPNG